MINEVLQNSIGSVKPLFFAGDDVAAVPGEQVHKFAVLKGKQPAEHCVTYFKSLLENSESTQTFVFLVGGPGNGKSLLLASAVAGYDPLKEYSDDLHHRSYKYLVGERSLHLVNDATIRGENETGSRDSLINDIDNAIEDGSFLLAGVNRGILLDELMSDRETSLGREIVVWLNKRGEPSGNLNQFFEQSYLKAAEVAGQNINLVAVFMDAISLFEEDPDIRLADPLDASECSNYTVQLFNERDASTCSNTSAGELLNKLFSLERGHFPIESEAQKAKYAYNPIFANLENLSNPIFQANLLSFLRASEIATGNLLNFRSIWGFIGVALMGNRSDLRLKQSEFEWIEECLDVIPEDAAVIEKPAFESMLKLATLRTHQAIFGGDPCPTLPMEVQQKLFYKVPATESLSFIDPCRDSQLKPDSEDEDDGIAYLSEVFDTSHEDESFLDTFIEEMDDDDDPFNEVVTEFDRKLDRFVTAAITADNIYQSEIDKRKLLVWYSRYLWRLYSSAHRLPAFISALVQWTRIWNNAYSNPHEPGVYESQIRRFLWPKYNTASKLALPLYASRTMPLIEDPEKSLLVKTFNIDAQRWKWEVFGDSISLIPLEGDNREDGNESRALSLSVNFNFVRELEVRERGDSGSTEKSVFSEPILERYRATMLHAKHAPVGSSHSIVSLETAERLVILEIGNP